MNWADVAKKNSSEKIERLDKRKMIDPKKQKPIDIYPEDLFEMQYLEDIRELNIDMKKEIYATGAELLNYNYGLHELYEFIVYHTNLESFQEELLNEESEI